MADFIDYVRDQFQRLGPYSIRSMFGGHGLFWQGTMFGLVASDTLYLRTDEHNRSDYETRGLMPFKPWHEKRVVLKAYYPLPEGVLEDTELAVAWAKRAVDAALAAAKHKSPPGLPAGSRAAQPRRGGNRVVPASRIRRSRGAAD
jgi:DNA transformation protein